MKNALILLGVVALISSITGCGGLASNIAEQIEVIGSELTEVPVEVKNVNIRIGGVSGEVTGLTIPNPDGYETVNAIEMNMLRLNIGLFASLGGSPIVLDELVIDSPVLTLEENKEGGSNLKQLTGNVKKNLEQAEAKPVEVSPTPGDSPEKPVRIAVRRLVIKGVTFNLLRRDGTLRSGILPAIELSDVGGDKGATPAGLGAVVITAMAGEMFKQVVVQKLMEGFRFEADRILSDLDQRLALTGNQRSKVVPVVEMITQRLNAAVDTWVEHGFVDIESLSKGLESIADNARAALQDALDSEQMQKLEAILGNLGQEAVEAIKMALVDRLGAALDISDVQMEKLRPILRQRLEHLAVLLNRFTSKHDISIEDFKSDYATLQSEIHQRMAEVLDADHMRELTKHENEIRERIQDILF